MRLSRFFFAPTEPPRLVPSPFALATLEAARSQLGLGEVGRNNSGPHVAKYCNYAHVASGEVSTGPWCACFGSWSMEQGARDIGLARCPVRRSHGARRLMRNVIKAGGVYIKEPEIAAVVCFPRDKAGKRAGHWAIIESINEDGSVVTIEGNKGRRGIVAPFPHDFDYERVVAMARLPDVQA